MSRSNGYAPAHGHVYAREAVAKKYSLQDRTVTAEDVILANGCSEALKFIIHCIVGEGDNLLVPFPGFTLYITVHSIFFSIVHSCQNYQSHSLVGPEQLCGLSRLQFASRIPVGMRPCPYGNSGGF